MSTQEIFEQIEKNYLDFKNEHQEFNIKQKKSSAARARKAIQTLKSFISDYRKASNEEVKNIVKK